MFVDSLHQILGQNQGRWAKKHRKTDIDTWRMSINGARTSCIALLVIISIIMCHKTGLINFMCAMYGTLMLVIIKPPLATAA